MKNLLGLIVALALVGGILTVLGRVFHWDSGALAAIGLAAGIVVTSIYDAKRGVE